MSSIGKIFVIVNLVLSVLVLGAAGALLKKTNKTESDYKAVAEELATAKGELDQARSEFAERERSLNADKQRLQEEREDVEVQRQNLERNVSRLEADNQQLANDVSAINATLKTLESAFSSTEQRVAELNDQNATLREQVMTARSEANQAERARGDAEGQLADAQRAAAEAGSELAAVRDELATANKLVEVAKAAGFDSTTLIAMPRIEANVAEVDEQYGFVVLDKGSNDSVERGFTFDVHRNGQYLGRVKVDETYANYATARIEIRAPGAHMQRMDKASTHLN
jgi:predicted  nucleic acid-binding Zn-ribbon protein